MQNNNCRCCGKKINIKPLLEYENLPKSAQFFPLKDELEYEKGVELKIFQCPFCGLIQILGEPVPYYRDVIRATGVSNEMRIFREEQFKTFLIDYNLLNSKIIEIGAGCGEYMQFMKSVGANVYGLEHMQESVDKCMNKGLQVYKGFLEEESYGIPEGPYDAFYIMNFLEHIPKPSEFLTAIFHNLNDSAIGIVEVPNVNMIFNNMLFSEFINDHLMYFTKETLTLILENNGFEVIEIKEIWYDYIISATVRKKTMFNVSDFMAHKIKITNSVKDYIKSMEDKGVKVAAWGAGHQALADFSLLDMGSDIEYVIDSADFKQNHYTPATHLPVVAPDLLNDGTIGAVLIMAAGYSDEISNCIENKWPDIGIAVLRHYGVEVIK